MELLSEEVLERSAVVANCRMNRERRLAGSNSYARELGFNPIDLLVGRLEHRERVAWLDLCCGTGRALIEAPGRLQAGGAPGVVLGDPGSYQSAARGAEPRVIVRRGRMGVASSRGGWAWSAER